MHYHVSRNGQTYGPYTLEDLQRYVASGNVLPTDLAKTDEMTDWLPVSQILGEQAATAPSAAFATPGYASPVYADPAYNPAAAMAASPYPDAPNLHWGLVLLFGFLTCSLFMVVWNLVVAAWLKRVQPNATSMFYYIGFAVLMVVQIMVSGMSSVHTAMHPGMNISSMQLVPALVWLTAWIVKLIARYSQMSSLEEHFNGPEPVGLRLNGVMVFFFGGVYFQYHLNKINEMKQAARFGRPQQFS
jgi:GYF domain 2